MRSWFEGMKRGKRRGLSLCAAGAAAFLISCFPSNPSLAEEEPPIITIDQGTQRPDVAQAQMCAEYQAMITPGNPNYNPDCAAFCQNYVNCFEQDSVGYCGEPITSNPLALFYQSMGVQTPLSEFCDPGVSCVLCDCEDCGSNECKTQAAPVAAGGDGKCPTGPPPQQCKTFQCKQLMDGTFTFPMNCDCPGPGEISDYVSPNWMEGCDPTGEEKCPCRCCGDPSDPDDFCDEDGDGWTGAINNPAVIDADMGEECDSAAPGGGDAMCQKKKGPHAKCVNCICVCDDACGVCEVCVEGEKKRVAVTYPPGSTPPDPAPGTTPVVNPDGSITQKEDHAPYECAECGSALAPKIKNNAGFQDECDICEGGQGHQCVKDPKGVKCGKDDAGNQTGGETGWACDESQATLCQDCECEANPYPLQGPGLITCPWENNEEPCVLA